VQVVRRPAIAGLVAEEVVELAERDRAALHVPIAARLLEDLDQLVAPDGRVAADVRDHPLVGELDQAVAEVEKEPGDHGLLWGWLLVAVVRSGEKPPGTSNQQPSNIYMRNTPNRGAAISAL
jgi:hypothetical protein